MDIVESQINEGAAKYCLAFREVIDGVPQRLQYIGNLTKQRLERKHKQLTKRALEKFGEPVTPVGQYVVGGSMVIGDRKGGKGSYLVVTQKPWTHPSNARGEPVPQEDIDQQWHDILTQVENDPCPGCGWKANPSYRDYENHHPECPVRRYGDDWEAEVKKAEKADERLAKRIRTMADGGMTQDEIVKKLWPHAVKTRDGGDQFYTKVRNILS